MKFYIEHECITRVTSLWEVEADSGEEAIKKLDNAGLRNSTVANIMDDPRKATFEETNTFGSKPQGDYYTLSDYMEE